MNPIYLCARSDSLLDGEKPENIKVKIFLIYLVHFDTGSVQMPLIAAFLVLFASPLLSANAQGSWFSPGKMFS